MFSRILEQDAGKFLDHLLALSPDDRYQRFACRMSDEAISKYVYGIDFKKDVVLGYLDYRHNLCAACHIGITGHHAEIGISVLEPYRGNGVAKLLWRRAVIMAKAKGCEEVSAQCLRMNPRMVSFAKSQGMRIISEGSEIFADQKVPKPDIFDKLLYLQQLWSEHYLFLEKLLK